MKLVFKLYVFILLRSAFSGRRVRIPLFFIKLKRTHTQGVSPFNFGKVVQIRCLLSFSIMDLNHYIFLISSFDISTYLLSINIVSVVSCIFNKNSVVSTSHCKYSFSPYSFLAMQMNSPLFQLISKCVTILVPSVTSKNLLDYL